MSRSDPRPPELPPILSGFDVELTGEDVELHHSGTPGTPGTPVTDAEGKVLWDARSTAVFEAGGNGAMYPAYKCPDAADPGCFHFDAWTCQVTATEVARRISTIVEAAADRRRNLDLREVERSAARARDREEPPTRAALRDIRAKRSAPFHEQRPRQLHRRQRMLGRGQQPLHRVVPARGGETDIAILHEDPWFCGCVDKQCTWFTQ